MHVRFDATDRITIGPHNWVFIASDTGGHTFARADLPAVRQVFAERDLVRLYADPSFRFDPGWYAPAAQRARAQADVTLLSSLPSGESKLILLRLEYVNNFLRAEAAKQCNRSEASMARFIDETARRLADRSNGGGMKRKSRFGQQDLVDRPMCTRSLRRWLKTYAESDFNPLALRDRTRLCGNRTDRLTVDVRQAMDVAVAAYMTEKRPTRRHCYKFVLGHAIGALNEARTKLRLPPRRAPSFQTFNAAINARSDFEICAGRLGLKYAKAKYFIVSQGLDVDRPCQRWEMDSWTVDLQTLLGDEDREALGKDAPHALTARMNLCVCMDVGTRCIMGMRLSRTPQVDNALRTLEMAVRRDKSLFADLTDCATPWDMCGVPAVLATDSGAEFLGDLQRAAIDLGADSYLPPAGMAEQRGHIERLFRTISDQALATFTGRTFGNTALLGDYPAQEQASIDTEALAAVLTRWVVDEYHNTSHGGLYGETPRAAWARLTRLFPVVPPPDRHRLRAIFGMKLERKLSAKGVRVLNLFYQSAEIQKLRRADRDLLVTVSIDVHDLGRISVWDGEGWHTVECVRAYMDDVTLAVWLATLADLRERHSAQAAVDHRTILDAVRERQRIAATSERRANIKSRTPSRAEIERTERDLLIGFSMPLSDEPPAATGLGETIRRRATPARRGAAEKGRPQDDSDFEIED